MSYTKFNPSFPITQDGKQASQVLRDYLRQHDNGILPVLENAANDEAAAAAGVPIGAMYRNGSVLQVRVN